MFFGGYPQSRNDPHSPARANTWGSPFRKTATPLPDITFNDTLPPISGSNAGNAGMMGTRVVRTIKDYEDQLATLKTENFNLKLRIYFLEEEMGVTPADRDAIKKNMELKMNNDSLKKELDEKQELLCKAAMALKLMEEQQEESARSQKQYEQKIAELEKDLEGLKVENEEKTYRIDELAASLEAKTKASAESLETQAWARELASERDQLKEQLELETRAREKLALEKSREASELRDRLRNMEKLVRRSEATVKQYESQIAEKEAAVREKSAALDEKRRTCAELGALAEKRKRQVEQLRASVKTTDDALVDLTNKHRVLLSQQSENGYMKPSPSSSPTTMQHPYGRFFSSNVALDGSRTRSLTENDSSSLDWEPNKEGFFKSKSVSQCSCSDAGATKDFSREIEEKDLEIKRQEEARKQLTLKLCNVQKQAEVAEHKLRKLERDHEKALKVIQGFMERQERLESKIARSETAEDPERDRCEQRRFVEMESKIGDLRGEIEIIKAEKSRLERQIQTESEELKEQLQEKDQRIEILEIEKTTMREELIDKTAELEKLKEVNTEVNGTEEQQRLLGELKARDDKIEDMNGRIERLTKELQVKTQNLQKLVNTELWSKNKEIAKLHNHMTASQCPDRGRNRSDTLQDTTNGHLTSLINELNEIGLRVSFTDDSVRLIFSSGEESVDLKAISELTRRLVSEKNALEEEVDYLKWLKLVSRPDASAEVAGLGGESEKAGRYCELLRTHLKDLVKFMKEMLKSVDRADVIGHEHKRIVLDVLLSSKILSDDLANALEGISSVVDERAGEPSFDEDVRDSNVVRRSRSENIAELGKNQASTQSDSEAFSEPDRTVSMARIGLQETQKAPNRPRYTKYTKTFSDSEDSIEYVPYHKTYQADLNDPDANNQIQELKETNSLLYTELNALRNDLHGKVSIDSTFDEKLMPLLTRLEKSQRFCDKLQSSLEKRIHECHALKKENKQNGLRKAQLEKKITDVENMAAEMTKQKTELLHYKENAERKTAELLTTLGKENETLRSRIKKLEDENESAKENIARLGKELDHLTLSHSQILVENTKLTNDKLRLEQEIRKTENCYDVAVRAMHDKFNKEISDLNQINDSHRARMQELEVANKELRRHVAICEASDSAPSSSGVSSIPTDGTLKQPCEDIIQEYQSYNSSQYWLPINYPTFGGRSKSSCSPDLGIESDAGITITRPLQDTLKITESMTNLLSDEDNGNGNRGIRATDSDSPLPLEGLDEMEALKQENETLKRRLMKTRRALEDTFQHLSASNKNKKNVEKAITKQLMITKSILKKTRTYEEPSDN